MFSDTIIPSSMIGALHQSRANITSGPGQRGISGYLSASQTSYIFPLAPISWRSYTVYRQQQRLSAHIIIQIARESTCI
jgi:hypothetical protein